MNFYINLTALENTFYMFNRNIITIKKMETIKYIYIGYYYDVH